MWIACDEAGHTGPDLLAKDQNFFAFASVNISDDEAWTLISKARQAYPVQMPELKASKLMGSQQGRKLVMHIIGQLDGRFALNAHEKLLALCGWVFEYIFEPVYQRKPQIFYQKDFHRFIAMFCYLWFQDERSEAKNTLAQFQAFMRSKDIRDAPALFEFTGLPIDGQPHPFELIQRFATGHKDIIAQEVSNIQKHMTDKGTWTLDLSASCLWSHLNHWGKQKEPLTVICDDSKPLRSIADFFNSDENNVARERVSFLLGSQDLGWEFNKPFEFVDSRAHPSVQIADVLASTAVYCFSKGLPSGMETTGEIMDRGMLRDSIFPDFERVNLENDKVKVDYAVLYELAVSAEGRGTGAPIEVYYEIAERGVASGELMLK
ncbi:hypothetical protein PsAD5_03072 [Pseudovibrio sp. Ad5]|uniref:DUF3800 domain-containing protein n=1 Tax=Pseudovibrio sp. Ad5 TaxID=989436 RepID=UPI0007AE718A|nr:DUF3800 domain-containing protein [Pseudovibrio sp. Ad5]KZK93358.1 hypothetical protein PsAD5_03072 [Pseudovibrio sp. Ad5]